MQYLASLWAEQHKGKQRNSTLKGLVSASSLGTNSKLDKNVASSQTRHQQWG